MRKLLIGMAAAGMLTAVGPALAAGPSGSNEGNTNVVTCNRTTGQAGTGVNVYQAGNGAYVGSNGVEVCSDDNSAIDGRAMVSSKGYAAADGDSSNPTEAQGWAKVDAGGPRCNTEGDNATTPDNDATLAGGQACSAP